MNALLWYFIQIFCEAMYLFFKFEKREWESDRNRWRSKLRSWNVIEGRHRQNDEDWYNLHHELIKSKTNSAISNISTVRKYRNETEWRLTKSHYDKPTQKVGSKGRPRPHVHTHTHTHNELHFISLTGFVICCRALQADYIRIAMAVDADAQLDCYGLSKWKCRFRCTV